MNFHNKLNNYIDEIGCSAKELAKASNLSEATISRYCNGSRLPLNPSEQLDKLINGLSILARTKKIPHLNEQIIKQELNDMLKNYDFEKVINNFNTLVPILKINISSFSKTLGFDASYLSKIRSGQRKPSDPNMFFEAICNYIINNYNDDDSKKVISLLIDCSLTTLNNNKSYKETLSSWLCSDYKIIETNNNINIFLTKLNDFDLNEYIRVINFDNLKVPTVPFNITKSKNYYGINEMKQGEIDFFKSTILSKSNNNKEVFMCSDMQMNDMAEDLEFGKKWMFAIAMMLKKGLHLNIIHNLDRPFNEMMVGLESWIPIYMTGQVSPYYLTNNQNNIYSHFNYVSNNVALTGECIKGYHNKGKYYLTNNKTEVAYFQEKANLLLKKAHPLMTIYRENDIDNFNIFLNNNSNIKGNRKIISASLPIYTINDKLLTKILKNNNICEEDSKKILDYVKKEKERIQIILKENQVQELITKISKKEFSDYPPNLELSKLFYPKKINYTYNEYLEYLKSTKEFEINHTNYSLILNKNNAFRNIKILIHLNKLVTISKINEPAVHFVIEHPKLCKAIENFIVPIVEQE